MLLAFCLHALLYYLRCLKKSKKIGNIFYLLECPSKSNIKNSIKPYRLQYALRHIYYTTMKIYVNLKHCLGQKTNIKVIKIAHRRSNFSKTLVSQEIICFEIPSRILDLEKFIFILKKILSMLP